MGFYRLRRGLREGAKQGLSFEPIIYGTNQGRTTTRTVRCSHAVGENHLDCRIGHRIQERNLGLRVDVARPGVLVVRGDVVAFRLFLKSLVIRSQGFRHRSELRGKIVKGVEGGVKLGIYAILDGTSWSNGYFVGSLTLGVSIVVGIH